jgi:hypothetical protein
LQIKALVIACLLAIAGIWAYAHAQTSSPPLVPHEWIALPDEAYTLPPGQNGRYQLITASVDSVANPHTESGENIPTRTVIRIDTQTGRTWRLVEIAGWGGFPTHSWEPINESKLKDN